MNFWQRFRFFLIGFIPGSIILIMILNKKGCTSPNELKMLELSHQHMQLGEKAKCKLKCLVLTENGFKVTLRDMEVNYDLSDVHKKPYGLYYLQPKKGMSSRYELLAEDKDTVTFINDLKLQPAIPGCSCDSIR
jgi:hypothetical protein